MLLYGKPVVKKLFTETVQWVQKNSTPGAYVGFLLVSNDYASQVYVTKKQQYAVRCGLGAKLFHEPDASFEATMNQILVWNADPACLGIVLQLPVSEALLPYQAQLIDAIDPQKDIDGLGGIMFGKNLTEVVNFIPATPKAVYELLAYYGVDSFVGKKVLMIGQSNLIGKPFVLEAMCRGATVVSTNSSTDPDFFGHMCHMSDYIISATGVNQLLTPQLFADASLVGKVIIDIGYGIKDGKACGDTDWQGLAELGATITPVPGGIGPVTVACLFHNLLSLEKS